MWGLIMILQRKKYGYFDMISLSFKVSPLYSMIFAVQRILGALIPTIMIFVTARFINTALAVLNKTEDINAIHVPIILLASIVVYNVLIGILMSFVQCRANIYYRRKLRPEMIEKRARLEYRHIENQMTADLINRVCPAIDANVRDMYARVLDVADGALFILGIVITLFTQVWWVALFILVSSVPIMIIATKAGQRSYEADKEVSKIDRRANYLSEVLKSREAVEERSIYGYAEKLNQQYGERYHFARKFRLKVTRSNFIKNKMGGIITSFLSIITMLAMLGPVTRGEIDYGMFIALMSAVFGLSMRLSWGVNWLVEDLARRKEYLKDLTEFMALEENAGANVLPKEDMSFERLEFKDVSFKYPGTDKLILDKVSFVIENGKHYSFVGVNGAGKTTITKLITGLYDNYEGEILVDGRSLRELSAAEIKGLSSVVYQDFAKYYISMYDNIAIADLNRQDCREEVEKAAELAGLSQAVEKLADGLDTHLGKIHEKGVDISGGEWQRVAMARSIVSPAPLRILDEPTAALDPIGESMVYRQFEQISRGKTTIFISHRLGSTKLADVIYVLADGKIVESGSHSELMAKKGIYYEMFNAQAEWYAANGQAGVADDSEVMEHAG
jgi:ATP-binding cassette subfamily B protein